MSSTSKGRNYRYSRLMPAKEPNPLNGTAGFYSEAPPLEQKDLPSSTASTSSDPHHGPSEDSADDPLVIDRLKYFADMTTAHGAKRVLVARTKYSRCLWIMLLMMFFCILGFLVSQLYIKFTRHDKITSIAMKFDTIQFPAITFCNLNPYKRSLVRMVPSVRDTMDVYDNAKTHSKEKNDTKVPKLKRNDFKERSENAVRDLFKAEIEEEEERLRASGLLPPKPSTLEGLSTDSALSTDDDDGGDALLGGIPVEDDGSSVLLRQKRQAHHQKFEAIEAHCRCIGKPNMECIRFESPPKNDKSKCICTLDLDEDKAWPCFNASFWYDHRCPVCSAIGTCEAEAPEGNTVSPLLGPTAESDGIAEGYPCACRNRTEHYEKSAPGDKEYIAIDPDPENYERPYCIRKRSPVEMRKLWIESSPAPPTTTTTTTTPPPTTTTTLPPSTTTEAPPPPPLPTAKTDHIQRPIVTNPETIKAMGFSGMTDGVAMLTKAKENLMFTMAALSVKQRIALSQDKREFIEMCSFNGHECDIDNDFRQHVDPEFGNCYTFNYNVSKDLTSSRAGPMYGIRVLLFVNTSDYMSTSESSGVRLAIHNPTEYPFPDTFGYSAPVGFASSFGIRKQKVERLPGYGDCFEGTEAGMNYIYRGYDYHPEGCHRSCFQNRVINNCSCGDPRFPVPPGYKHCSAFNATARDCLEQHIGSTGDFHHITQGMNECVCKHSCDEEVYTMTFSASKWPSGATDLGDCEGMTEQVCEDYYRKNAAMVEVFYEQLNYELLQESEAYGFVNLIADFGGHLGLWMGFSVITIVEVLALLLDVATSCIRRGKHKREEEEEHLKRGVKISP